jgi:hypothetical protein
MMLFAGHHNHPKFDLDYLASTRLLTIPSLGALRAGAASLACCTDNLLPGATTMCSRLSVYQTIYVNI